MSKPIIPTMTDPMGQYWKQPDLADIHLGTSMNGCYWASMSRSDFDKLADYTHSRPTGTYPGKMWKRQWPGGWVLCWMEDCPDDPKMIGLGEAAIHIIEEEIETDDLSRLPIHLL